MSTVILGTIATPARLTTILRRVFIEQPIAWGVFALAFFAEVSRLPINNWNVEIMIARNLLRGHGFVVGPMDAPALWRPPLAVFALLPIEMVAEDPKVVYQIYATLCLTVTTVGLFYLMKHLGGLATAHFSQLAAFSLPAFIALVNRQIHIVSHLTMFATVVPAMVITIAAWTSRRRAADAGVGLAWSLAFLARTEMVLLFGVTFVCSAIVYRQQRLPPPDLWRRLGVQAACWLLVALPAIVTVRQLQRQHGLIGQEALITYYTGEFFASNRAAEDRDGAGYVETLRRFGDPAAYQYSLVRFALANPEAVLRRITQNIHNTIEIFAHGPLVRPTDLLVFIAFGALLAMSQPPPLAARHLLLYSGLLTAAASYYLLFHPDLRYLMAFALMLFITAQILALVLWQRIARAWPALARSRVVIAVCTAVLVGLTAFRLSGAVATAGNAEVDLSGLRSIAVTFRDMIGQEGTPAVEVRPPIDAFWFSYFANTAIPWNGNNSVFPRDRIYSFTSRPAEYALVPASTDLSWYASPRILWSGTFPVIGEYVCFDVRSRSHAP